MKNNLRKAGMCFFGAALLAGNALAVWPPFSAVENPSPVDKISSSASAEPQSSEEVAEKLKGDEQKLQQILADLKKNREDLTRLSTKPSGTVQPNADRATDERTTKGTEN